MRLSWTMVSGRAVPGTTVEDDTLTWDELKQRIETMTPEQRQQPLTFIEPYQDEQEIFQPDIYFAEEEIKTDIDQIQAI